MRARIVCLVFSMTISEIQKCFRLDASGIARIGSHVEIGGTTGVCPLSGGRAERQCEDVSRNLTKQFWQSSPVIWELRG
jgi:hypothetical protein